MFEKVKTRLLEYVDFPEDQILPETEIIRDLKMNSFDIVSMLGEFEEEFGITLSQEDIASIVTVDDLSKCILAHINSNK